MNYQTPRAKVRYGCLLHRKEKSDYVKLYIGVEKGYYTSCIIIRVKKIQKHLIKDLHIGDKLIFDGRYIQRGSESQFIFHFIVKHTFNECPNCLQAMHGNICLKSHDTSALKLDGAWIVVYKSIQVNYIKIYFENKLHQVFSLVATRDDWCFENIKMAKKGDKVEMLGWRYNLQTSIRSFRKL